MNRNLVFTLLTGVLAIVAGVSWYLYYYQLEKHKNELEWSRQLEENVTKKTAELNTREAAIAQAEHKAKEAARKAEEAERMAEEHIRQLEEEKQRRIAELNEKLAQAAADREKAEASLTELERKMKALEEAYRLATEKISALRMMRERQGLSGEEESQLDAALAALAEQKAEIERLRRERQKLAADYSKAKKNQIEMEEVIVDSGGEITIEGYVILSPNIKRRHNFYLKDRYGK